jgi:hypothetical protein
MPHTRNWLAKVLGTLALTALLLASGMPPSLSLMPRGVRAAAGRSAGLRFERVFIVVLENQDYDRALRQPFLQHLASIGALFTDFHAITHSSYPNYLAMAAGSTFGIEDNTPQDLDARSLVDLFEAAGVTWKVYAENLPSPCFTGHASPDGLYVHRHEPYISFRAIQSQQAWCGRILNAAQLQADLAQDALPQYSFYVPNLRNDGHDTGVAYADSWLQGFLAPLLLNPHFSRGTLVIVTFDENARARGNQIYTVFAGPMVQPGITSGIRYDHYSLLRTIEDNYGLATLGREDAKASVICCVWKE